MDTNLVVVFRALVLNEQFQAFLPNLWLCGTAATVAAFRLVVVNAVIVISRFVRFTDHLALAEGPHHLHARLRVANMPDSVCKLGIRLTARKITQCVDEKICRLGRQYGL